MNIKKIFLFSLLWCLVTALCLAGQATAAVKVRVQPSGADTTTSYVLAGESRTYFGNAEGSDSGSYEYKWDFSDDLAPNTAWVSAGDPNYISVDHIFSGSGLSWAKLSVREYDGALEVSATIEVKVLSTDDANRKKNSAVDRGLRRLYLDANRTSSGFYWNGYDLAATGMALVAMENQGHNLEAGENDIYKPLVQEGLKYIFNRAQIVSLSNQECIGDPESNDGDSDNDGIGISFPGDGWSENYESPIAMLAIVNSCKKDLAKTLTVSEGPLAGQTYWDVMIDAKDFLAFAQTDYSVSNDPYWSDNCWSDYSHFYGWKNSIYNYSFYLENDYNGIDDLNCDGNGLFKIEYGDGAVETGIGDCYNNSYENWYTQQHTYVPGTYTAVASVSHDHGDHWVQICSLTFTVSAPECPYAGWRYARNDGWMDNSVSQWPTLALQEAKDRWGIGINPKVNELLKGWLVYSQDSTGGFGYDGPNSWDNIRKTGAGLAMLKWTGFGTSDANVQNALSFIGSQWDFESKDGDIYWWGNLGDFYAMYAVYKGMKYQGISTFTAHFTDDDGNAYTQDIDWEQIYDQYLIAHQDPYGYFTSDRNDWIPSPFMTTYISLAILAPAVAGLPPVADAGGPYASVAPGQTVYLDDSGSTHRDPTKHLVKYDWDFDASNGLWWTTKSSPDLWEGATSSGSILIPTSYPDAGSDKTYTVTLRVIDDNDPALTDTDTATISVTSGNVPPVAKTNGPWFGYPGSTLTFDGSASYDPNSCTTSGDPSCLGDSIVKYEWDLDGDGVYDGPGDGTDAAPPSAISRSVVTKTFPTPISKTVSLRVTDKFGLTNEVTGQIIAIAVVYGNAYQWGFQVALDRYTYRMGLIVKFKNLGTSEAKKVVATLTNVPSNYTILKNTAVLGDMAPGVIKTTACNSATKTADLELRFDRRVIPVGDWRWKVEFDFNGGHYIIDNVPPLAP